MLVFEGLSQFWVGVYIGLHTQLELSIKYGKDSTGTLNQTQGSGAEPKTNLKKRTLAFKEGEIQH
jgi:hypothetical protein